MTRFIVHLSDRCIINPPAVEPARERLGTAGGLLALFIPKLIENAISGIATALKKAGGKHTVQLAGEAFSDMYVADAKQALGPNPALRCLIGVWFDDSGDGPPDDDAVRKLKEARVVPKVASVGGIFEALIAAMPDGTAFYLDTRYFSVREFIGKRYRRQRSYVLTVSVAAPNATVEGATFALGRIDFGSWKRGKAAIPTGDPEFPRYRSNLMPWSKISDSSKASYDRDAGAQAAAGRRYMPITFSLTVSETADGSEFLLKLGELLGGLAEKSAAEISKHIIPAEVEKAAAEDAARAEKLYEDELKAEKEVRAARKAYDAAADVDKPVLKVALVIAERSLASRTRLREAAGLPPRPAVDPT